MNSIAGESKGKRLGEVGLGGARLEVEEIEDGREWV
jgi:hypothetical protein